MTDREYMKHVIELLNTAGRDGSLDTGTFEVWNYIQSLKQSGLTPKETVSRLLDEWRISPSPPK